MDLRTRRNRRSRTCRGPPGPLDRVFHDQIGCAAHQDEVFDIIPANQNEAPPGIDRHRVDHSEARHPASANAAEAAGRVSPNKPIDERDQREDDDGRHPELQC